MQGASLASFSIELVSPDLFCVLRAPRQTGMLRREVTPGAVLLHPKAFALCSRQVGHSRNGQMIGLSDETGLFSRQRNQSKQERHVRALTGQVWGPQTTSSWFAQS